MERINKELWKYRAHGGYWISFKLIDKKHALATIILREYTRKIDEVFELVEEITESMQIPEIMRIIENSYHKKG